MNFNELVQQRTSVRKFTNEKIAPEEVQAILRAALKSPSSKNKKPWQFVLIEDQEMLQKLSACKKFGAKPIESCALAVVVVGEPLESDVWIEDASIATIFMQLQAEDLGLGSCWIQIRERNTEDGISSDEYIKKLLQIPSQMQVLSILAVGHKAQQRTLSSEDDLEWEKVHLEQY